MYLKTLIALCLIVVISATRPPGFYRREYHHSFKKHHNTGGIRHGFFGDFHKVHEGFPGGRVLTRPVFNGPVVGGPVYGGPVRVPLVGPGAVITGQPGIGSIVPGYNVGVIGGDNSYDGGYGTFGDFEGGNDFGDNYYPNKKFG